MLARCAESSSPTFDLAERREGKDLTRRVVDLTPQAESSPQGRVGACCVGRQSQRLALMIEEQSFAQRISTFGENLMRFSESVGRTLVPQMCQQTTEETENLDLAAALQLTGEPGAASR